VGSESVDEVKHSLGRALLNGDVFGTFYDNFLDSDPRIPILFSSTSWEDQKALLRQGVNSVISFYEGSATGKSAMTRIRHTHGRDRMNIPPDLYEAWVKSMVRAVEQHDQQFTPALGAMWQEVLSYGADYIRAGYEE